jgi:hypothetical protein
LSLKSLWKVSQVDPGFNPRGLLTFRISAPARLKGQPYVFYQQVAEKVGSLPAVQMAVVARDVPMSGIDPSMPVAVDGKTPQVTDGQIITRFRVIGPDYFRAFQTPLLRGREFTADDAAASQPVAIVSQSLLTATGPNRIRSATALNQTSKTRPGTPLWAWPLMCATGRSMLMSNPPRTIRTPSPPPACWDFWKTPCP